MKFAIVLLGLVAVVASQGVNVVDNSDGVNVVDNSGGNPFPNNPEGFVIDEGFYQPGNPSDGYLPISNGPAYVDKYQGPKYDNPMLRNNN